MIVPTKYEKTPTPYYLALDDRLLIGTNHEDIATENGVRLLNQKLSSREHLIIEGNRKNIESALAYLLKHGLPLHYEDVAYAAFKGQKHFLEESLRWSELASKYGISKDFYGLYSLLVMQRKIALKRQKTGQHFYEIATEYLDVERREDCESIDVEKTVRQHKKLLVELQTGPLLLFRLGDIFAFYIGRLRDFEYIGPKAQELDLHLKGKKTFMVGISHLEALEKSLQGHTLEKPKEWRKFVEGLGQEVRELIELVEQMSA